MQEYRGMRWFLHNVGTGYNVLLNAEYLGSGTIRCMCTLLALDISAGKRVIASVGVDIVRRTPDKYADKIYEKVLISTSTATARNGRVLIRIWKLED